MSTEQLENLVKIGQLKKEPPDREQFDGMIRSARIRLAGNYGDSIEWH